MQFAPGPMRREGRSGRPVVRDRLVIEAPADRDTLTRRCTAEGARSTEANIAMAHISRRAFVKRVAAGMVSSASATLGAPGWLKAARPSAPGNLAAAPSPPASQRPRFGWERVPLYAHVGKRSGDFSEQELEFLSQHFGFVTIEKGQGMGKHGWTEEGIYEAARQLNKLNPRMTVLFYWNAFLDYPLYRASKGLDPSWHLKTRAGEPVLVRDRVKAYDLSLPEVQQWWSNVAGRAVREARLDGIFADALPQVLTPGKAGLLGEAKHQAIKKGLQEMLPLAQREMGGDKIILANGTRAKAYTELLDWASISGVMIEHFGHFRCAGSDDIAADMQTIETASRKGKIVVVKGWPGFSFLDREMMQKPRAELAKLSAERITFPLACFLAAAGERCYFCYTWGYTEKDGTFEWYPEFDKPLGEPKGPAARNGYVYTREFAHAAVRVDLDRKEGRIDWRNP